MLLAAAIALYCRDAADSQRVGRVSRHGRGADPGLDRAAGAWLLQGVRRGRLELRLGWTAVALSVLLLWCCCSAMVMGPRGDFRAAINMAWQWLSFGVGFFLLCQLAREPAELCVVARHDRRGRLPIRVRRLSVRVQHAPHASGVSARPRGELWAARAWACRPSCRSGSCMRTGCGAPSRRPRLPWPIRWPAIWRRG